MTLPRNNLSDYESVRSIAIYDMGKIWRPRRTCHYPLHSGRKKELKTRNAVNHIMSSRLTKLDSNVTFCDKCSIVTSEQSFFVNQTINYPNHKLRRKSWSEGSNILKKSHTIEITGTRGRGYRNSRMRSAETVKLSSWFDLKLCALKGINVLSTRRYSYNRKVLSTWMHSRYKMTPLWSQINTWFPLLESI